ncbi:MAG: hypothetical protein JST21_16795 [Bacteroidetes bacterium]|nr:hypothetical protein [Bacteroidota bacterium]
MKKAFIVLTAALTTLTFTNINAQPYTTAKAVREDIKSDRITLRKLRGTEVSNFSKQNFETRFPKATNVTWIREDYFDVASYTMNNKSMKAYYDEDSHLVGTISPSTFDKLPISARNYIGKHYKGYSPEKVIFYDDNEANSTDMIMYNTQFEDMDSYFVELSNGTHEIVLHVFKDGNVMFFKSLS